MFVLFLCWIYAFNDFQKKVIKASRKLALVPSLLFLHTTYQEHIEYIIEIV